MNKTLKAKIVEKYGTQADFAQAINAHESIVSRVVRNRKTLPLTTKEKWAKALGCRAKEVFLEGEKGSCG